MPSSWRGLLTVCPLFLLKEDRGSTLGKWKAAQIQFRWSTSLRQKESTVAAVLQGVAKTAKRTICSPAGSLKFINKCTPQCILMLKIEPYRTNGHIQSFLKQAHFLMSHFFSLFRRCTNQTTLRISQSIRNEFAKPQVSTSLIRNIHFYKRRKQLINSLGLSFDFHSYIQVCKITYTFGVNITGHCRSWRNRLEPTRWVSPHFTARDGTGREWRGVELFVFSSYLTVQPDQVRRPHST